MKKRPKHLKKRNWTSLYLVAGCVLVAGLLVFGLSFFDNSSAPVEGVSPPETAEAPAPVDDGAAKAKAKDAEEQAAKEKAAAEKQAAEEKAAAEQAAAEEKEKAAQEQAAQQQAAQGGVSPSAAPTPSGTDMYLSVPKMGISGDYVANGIDPQTLVNGAGHAPQSGFPWQPGSNTYIASHVLGYEGTGSYLHFANLPNMVNGDQIYLTDSNGTEYTYEVFEILQVSIYDTWVIDPTGEDIVSLQTCINPPAYDIRLVVRGKLTGVTPA